VKARTVPSTIFDAQARELRALKDRVSKLENAHVVTHPIYTPDYPDDAVETEIAFSGSQPVYYRDGAWHPFASGTGDYVFLQSCEVKEIPDVAGGGPGVVGVINGDESGVVGTFDDDPIELGDVVPISQEYTHLVVEASLRDEGLFADFPQALDLPIILGSPESEEDGDENTYGAIYIDDSADPGSDPAPVSKSADRFYAIVIPQIIPQFDVGTGDTISFAQITLKFAFYTASDRSRTVIWQAFAQVARENPELEGDPVQTVQVAQGGAIVEEGEGGTWPIGQMTFQTDSPAGSSGWAEGCVVDLYGIRGRVSNAAVAVPPAPDINVTVTIDGESSAPLFVPEVASIDTLEIGAYGGPSLERNRRFDDVKVGTTPGGSDIFSDDFSGSLPGSWDFESASGVSIDSGELLIGDDVSALTSILRKNLGIDTADLPVYVSFKLRVDSTDTRHSTFCFMTIDWSFIAVSIPTTIGDQWNAHADGAIDDFGTSTEDAWVQVDIAIEPA